MKDRQDIPQKAELPNSQAQEEQFVHIENEIEEECSVIFPEQIQKEQIKTKANEREIKNRRHEGPLLFEPLNKQHKKRRRA
jgi:hypothetical protein